MTDSEHKIDTKNQTKSLRSFLETAPPGKECAIRDLGDSRHGKFHLKAPSIKLYCGSNDCGSEMWFDCDEDCSKTRVFDVPSPVYLLYVCRNCKESKKWFSFLASGTGSSSGIVKKLGEDPPFGPPTPARIITLMGADRDLFLKGRASEVRGLGIGALTYYRRVVENQWEHFIDIIIRVAKRLDLPTDILETAKNESQFEKAVEKVQDALPQMLSIEGHNPMTLLYTALREDVHELNDEQCLERAKHIRVVLIDFADRVGEALRERKELKDSLMTFFLPNRSPDTSDDADTDGKEDPNPSTE